MVVSGMVVSTRLGLNDEDVHLKFPLASFGAIVFQGAA
jgi:molybdopterin/thiamine biosynthesis adenylyltransferase